MNKALSIVEVLYLDNSLVFLFDNISSHLIYAKDVLCTRKIKKTLEKNNYTYIIISIKKMILTKYIP